MACCRLAFFLLLLLITFKDCSPAVVLPNAARSCKVPARRILTPCFCDNACDLYGDCCDRYRRPEPVFSCVNLFFFPFENRKLWGKSGLVIDKCPSKTSEKLKNLCERPLAPKAPPSHTTVPVFRPGMLFRNAYCAACNNFTGWQFPQTRLQCKKNVSAEKVNAFSRALVENGTCDFVFNLPTSAVRDCSNTGFAVGSCPRKASAEARGQCLTSPTSFVLCQEGRDVFRNVACARCWLAPKNCTRARGRRPGRMGSKFMRPQIRLFAMNYRYDLLLDIRPQIRSRLHQKPSKPPNIDLLSIASRDEDFALNQSRANDSRNESETLSGFSRPESGEYATDIVSFYS